MKRPDLAAARTAAALALGRGAERTLTRLEAAGLVVVRLADLSPTGTAVRTLRDVELIFPEDWSEPYALTVVPDSRQGGDPLTLHALRVAVPGIREARELHRIMGHRLDVEVDEGEDLVLRAWAVEP